MIQLTELDIQLGKRPWAQQPLTEGGQKPDVLMEATTVKKMESNNPRQVEMKEEGSGGKI